MNILDEHSRECLTSRVSRNLNSADGIDALTDLCILRGIPAFIRSDSGPESADQAVRDQIAAVGAKTVYIEPVPSGGTHITRASTPAFATSC